MIFYWGKDMSWANKAREFHEKITRAPLHRMPTPMGQAEINELVEHIVEELDELSKARTMADQIDAIVDLVYVAAGRMVRQGYNGDLHFDEVHDCNMRRVSGINPKRPASLGFDAIKPPGWKEPNHDAIALTTMLRNMHMVIVGHARHGKDSVAEVLTDKLGLAFTSSSMFCAERVVFPILGPKYGYTDAQACFDDRAAHRAEWYDLIRAYCEGDPAHLGREIFKTNNIYVGVRAIEELRAIQAEPGLVDFTVCIDASKRMPPESSSSMTITLENSSADYVLDNNGSVGALEDRVDELMKFIADKFTARIAEEIV